MLRISLFKTKSPRRFEYKPRYYDPKKEEMEDRYKNAEIELGVSDGKPTRRIKFERKGLHGDAYQREARQRLIRTLVILFAMGLLFWEIFKNLDALTELLTK